MSRTTSITVGPQLDNFLNRMLESGRYGSTSEVVRTALRLLEQQEDSQALLRKAIEMGEQSGESSLTLKEIAAQRKRRLDV